MPKGPYLTDKIKRLIKDVYLRNRQVGPTRAREELLKRMKAEGLNEIFGSGFPGISSVSKELKRLRDLDEERSDESKGLDEPWSPHFLPKYPIPPEALPLLMRIYGKNMCEASMPEWYLSIREALWVGRLYKILEFYYHDQMANWTNPDNATEVTESIRTGHLPENYQEVSFEDIVLDWAYVMAGDEEYRELSDEPSELEDIGVYMMGNVFYCHDERRLDFIYDLAEEYGIGNDKFRELVSMPIEDVNQFFIRLELERRSKETTGTGKGGTK